MKRILAVFLSLSLIGIFLMGCGTTKEDNMNQSAPLKKLVVQAPVGPPTVPLLHMQEVNTLGENVKFEVQLYKNMDEATARIVNNDVDLSVLPLNVASNLYNKGTPITLGNVNTWGILYIVSNGVVLNDWEDLKGQDVYIGNKGTTPDILARYLMSKNGIDPTKDVNIQYSTSPEIAQMLLKGIAKVAVLPEPLVTKVTMKDPNIKVALDFQEMWTKVEGESLNLPQAGIVIQNSTIKENKELIDKFQYAYSEAIKWVNENPQEAGQLAEKYLSIPTKVIENAMERMNIRFVSGKDAQEDVEMYLSRLWEYSPDIIGGEIPDVKFFYQE